MTKCAIRLPRPRSRHRCGCSIRNLLQASRLRAYWPGSRRRRCPATPRISLWNRVCHRLRTDCRCQRCLASTGVWRRPRILEIRPAYSPRGHSRHRTSACWSCCRMPATRPPQTLQHRDRCANYGACFRLYAALGSCPQSEFPHRECDPLETVGLDRSEPGSFHPSAPPGRYVGFRESSNPAVPRTAWMPPGSPSS